MTGRFEEYCGNGLHRCTTSGRRRFGYHFGEAAINDWFLVAAASGRCGKSAAHTHDRCGFLATVTGRRRESERYSPQKVRQDASAAILKKAMHGRLVRRSCGWRSYTGAGWRNFKKYTVRHGGEGRCRIPMLFNEETGAIIFLKKYIARLRKELQLAPYSRFPCLRGLWKRR